MADIECPCSVEQHLGDVMFTCHNGQKAAKIAAGSPRIEVRRMHKLDEGSVECVHALHGLQDRAPNREDINVEVGKEIDNLDEADEDDDDWCWACC